MRRVISVFICVAVALSAFVGFAISANAGPIELPMIPGDPTPIDPIPQGLLYHTHDTYVTIYDYTGSAKSLTIPKKIGEKPVTVIEKGAFAGCSSLNAVIIPGTVTKIGEEAFSRCTGLKTISLNDGIESIGDWAFYGCSSLSSVYIPKSVTDIGTSAFASCENLSTILVNSNNPNYSHDAYGVLFNKDHSLLHTAPAMLQDYSIPDTVTQIGANAFYGCDSLTELAIPNSVVDIGESAFKRCTGLTDIILPDGIVKIPNDAFYECSSLVNVNIPDGVTEIGYRAFYNCKKTRDLALPETITKVGYQAFEGCWGVLRCVDLYAIYLVCGSNSHHILYDYTYFYEAPASLHPDTVVIADSAFASANLTEVNIPDRVKVVGSRAFAECRKLSVVSLGNSVEMIGNNAFSGCNITGIELPDSVRYIGDSAFSDCDKLLVAILPDGVMKIGKYAFSECCNLQIVFEGAVPTVCEKAFCSYDEYAEEENAFGISAVVYYPDGDETWTDAARNSFGGNITWVSQKNALSGDFTGDFKVTNKDVEYFLWHTLFPMKYLLVGNGDYNSDGAVNNQDVESLLWYTLFPEDYPL